MQPTLTLPNLGEICRFLQNTYVCNCICVPTILQWHFQNGRVSGSGELPSSKSWSKMWN